MKKIFGFILLLISVVMSSCDTQTNGLSTENMKVSDMNFVGHLHNVAMTYTKDNFDLIDFGDTLSNIGKAKKILEFDKNGLSQKYPQYKSLENSNQYAQFMFAEKFGKYLLSNIKNSRVNESDILESLSEGKDIETLDLDSMPSLDQFLTLYKQEGVYSEKTLSFMDRIIALLRASLEGMVSDENFINGINSISEEFDKAGYEKDSVEGAAIASMLSIAKSSYEWWYQNPDYADSENQGKLPQVVAMDLGGACAGVIFHAFQNWNNRLTWGGVGRAALWGAISGSTGLGGRIGRLFR